MKKPLLTACAALSLLSAGAAHGQSAPDLDTRGLTPEQAHQIQVQIDETKAKQAAATPIARAQQISEYAQIGKGVAEGLGAAAKELNVAVNDFARTPVGQTTMWLIVYKVIGHDVLHLIFTLIWWLVSVPLWVYFYSKTWRPYEITTTYDEKGKKTGETRRVEPVNLAEDAVNTMRFTGLVPLLAIIGITFLVMP